MLSKLTVAGFGIAAALILAPAALADDLTNADVAGGNQSSAPVKSIPSDAIFFPGSGSATNAGAWMEDCKLVRGTWTDQGFVRDPNGHDTVWTKYGDGLLYSSPYDDGLSDSSRTTLNKIREKKAADKAAAASPSE